MVWVKGSWTEAGCVLAGESVTCKEPDACGYYWSWELCSSLYEGGENESSTRILFPFLRPSPRRRMPISAQMHGTGVPAMGACTGARGSDSSKPTIRKVKGVKRKGPKSEKKRISIDQPTWGRDRSRSRDFWEKVMARLAGIQNGSRLSKSARD